MLLKKSNDNDGIIKLRLKSNNLKPLKNKALLVIYWNLIKISHFDNEKKSDKYKENIKICLLLNKMIMITLKNFKAEENLNIQKNKLFSNSYNNDWSGNFLLIL